jgi:hypothetical protein
MPKQMQEAMLTGSSRDGPFAIGEQGTGAPDVPARMLRAGAEFGSDGGIGDA